jgi:hypothetical protein
MLARLWHWFLEHCIYTEPDDETEEDAYYQKMTW